ncbi:hypothetical protein [Bradyrhizobium elkanii]
MPHLFDKTPTAQQVFDAACAFFASSAGPSTGLDDICLYRDPTGRCCVAGNFIPDDKYDPRMDDMSEMPLYKPNTGGNALNNLIEHFGQVVPPWFKEHQRLLTRLQSVHDERDNWFHRGWDYDRLADHLKGVASLFKLDVSAIEPVAERGRIPHGWNVVEV